jgi:hypothetical protein
MVAGLAHAPGTPSQKSAQVAISSAATARCEDQSRLLIRPGWAGRAAQAYLKPTAICWSMLAAARLYIAPK